MSANSKIEWTDHTWSPWEGCQKAGPGCDHCYAEARNARFGGGQAVNWGPGAPRRRTSVSYWKQPIKWNAEAATSGLRRRVFPSLCDPFDNAVPAAWFVDFFDLIRDTPNLDWLLLTKRIGNVTKRLDRLVVPSLPSNVWLGATVVNQEEADRDIPKLLQVPARVRFLSMEPLLGPVDLTHIEVPRKAGVEVFSALEYDGDPEEDVELGTATIDWVIVGGESGPGARPMHPDWASSLRDQCEAAGVPFLFKQWGEWKPISQMAEAEHTALYRSRMKAQPHEDQGAIDDSYGRDCTVPYGVVHADGALHEPLEPMAFLQGTGAMTTFKIGKKAAGRLLDGVEWNGMPS
jgi:protein gp37